MEPLPSALGFVPVETLQWRDSVKPKQWGIWLVCLLTALLMIVGLGAIAAEYGSQSDPLVTLSYIQQVLLPQAQKDMDSKLAEAVKSYDSALSSQTKELETYVDRKLRSFAAGSVDDSLVDAIADAVLEKMGGSAQKGAVWETIQVPAGSTVICSLGVQLVLRQGQASCVAAGSPGLYDLSDGTVLENGGSLAANHLYAVNVQGRGIYAAQAMTLLISGSYTIS